MIGRDAPEGDAMLADWLRESVEELADAEEALGSANAALATAEAEAEAEAQRVAEVRRVHGTIIRTHPAGLSHRLAGRFRDATQDRKAGLVKVAREIAATAQARVDEAQRAVDELERYILPAAASTTAPVGAGQAPAAGALHSPVVGAAPVAA